MISSCFFHLFQYFLYENNEEIKFMVEFASLDLLDYISCDTWKTKIYLFKISTRFNIMVYDFMQKHLRRYRSTFVFWATNI